MAGLDLVAGLDPLCTTNVEVTESAITQKVKGRHALRYIHQKYRMMSHYFESKVMSRNL